MNLGNSKLISTAISKFTTSFFDMSYLLYI